MSADQQVAAPALITLGVSHFCEKARWALQRFGLHYVEEAHAPGFHRPAIRACGGRGTVPCLRLPAPPLPESASPSASATHAGLQCVDQSTPIMRWADSQAQAAAAEAQHPLPPPLFPPGPAGVEVERLCREFDRKLGRAVRLWAYSHLLYTSSIAQAMVAPPAPGATVPAVERFVLRCGGWLLLRRMMAKGMGITPEAGEAALCTIRQQFADVAVLLADGRRYLVGGSFSAADLTFAALAAPALGQPYGSAPGLDSATPPAMRGQVEELRGHPAGQYAIRVWEAQRGVVLRAPGTESTACTAGEQPGRVMAAM